MNSLAADLLALHRDPALLTVVNVWDAISAKVVADIPGTKAIATASHSIAASRGYPDGEVIPVAEMIAEIALIVKATTLPVTADLEAGYGDAAETVRRAIGVGAVGANIEDQLAPQAESAARVAAVMKAADDEGVPDFVLNARTDVFLHAADRDPADVLAEAVARGQAYLDAGAPVVFVPGGLDLDQTAALTEAFGPRRLTTIALPGTPPLPDLERLGVARVSFGPMPQRVALTALAELTETALTGGGVPEGTRMLT